MLLLDIRNLSVSFKTPKGAIKVLEHIDLRLYEGEFYGLVGESGSGKTLLVKAIVGISSENAIVTADKFLFNDIDMLKISQKKRRKIIGKYMSFISQEPQSSLDPLQKISKQLMRVIPRRTFKGKWWQHFYWRKVRAIELLHRVGIKDHDSILRSRPYELTESECQKVIIAMAFANQPKLLLADEPTNGMESVAETQVLRQLASYNQNNNTTILLISHDFQQITQLTERIHVIYCGQTVEIASNEEITKIPFHPYTEALVHFITDFESPIPHKSPLSTLSGIIPSLEHLPIGCRFGPRCPYAQKKCIKAPYLRTIRKHVVACHFPLNIEGN